MKNTFYKKFMKYLLTEPDTLFHTFHTLKHAAKFYDNNLLKTAVHAHRLLKAQGFSPQEAYPLGLLNYRNNCTNQYVSKAQIFEQQKKINPQSWCDWIRNKGCFYRYCEQLQIPVPELYALFFKDNQGWSLTRPMIKSDSQWVELLDTLPSQFIIKPLVSSHGRGVTRYRKKNRLFIDHLDRAYSAHNLIELLKNHAEYDAFLIQEVVTNHADIQALSHTDALQTLRIITLIDEQGICHIEHACLKIIVGKSIIDNHHGEECSNLFAKIDLATGTLSKAIGSSALHRERQQISYHPETGIQIEGFKLPLWNEARQLAIQIAPLFLPLRTIGWDIAVTADRPITIEANPYWDPPNL